VIKSGTYLDTTRLCVLLREIFEFNAFVNGEHGDSQVIARKSVTINGQTPSSFPEYQAISKELVEKQITVKAVEIIRLRDATFY
jgi:L-lactate dehydrogenase